MFPDMIPEKKVHTIPKNSGRGCSELFEAFANDGLIEIEDGDIEYHRR